jgi:two-component sensor histidine kinase
LITNSLKYAFDGRESGTITLTVRRKDEEYLLIEVEDDGSGLPEQVVSEGEYGFGLTLVEGYARQYKGEMRLYGNGGTRIAVTLRSDE